MSDQSAVPIRRHKQLMRCRGKKHRIAVHACLMEYLRRERGGSRQNVAVIAAPERISYDINEVVAGSEQIFERLSRLGLAEGAKPSIMPSVITRRGRKETADSHEAFDVGVLGGFIRAIWIGQSGEDGLDAPEQQI